MASGTICDLWQVIVGVGQYRDQRLGARSIAATLRGNDGWHGEERRDDGRIDEIHWSSPGTLKLWAAYESFW
jgi:hypothetical protein